MPFADRHRGSGRVVGTVPALCLALAIAALIPGGSSAKPSAGQAIGAVTNVEGTGVKVNGQSLDPGGQHGYKGSVHTLRAGDLVTTTGNGLVEYTVQVGKKVVFCQTKPVRGVGTVRVRPPPPKPKVLLDIQNGKSFCGTKPPGQKGQITLGKNERITMKDPVFEVAVGKGKKTVTVFSGVVVVSGKGGARTAVVVGPNKQTVVANGKAPGTVTPAGPLGPSDGASVKALVRVLPKQTDFAAPTITTVTGPPAQSKLATATFTFAASESGTIFSCKLDGGSFRLCQRRYEGLAAGPHTLVVRATDGAGNTGPGKTYIWTIVGTARTPGTTLLGVKGSIPYFDRLTGQHSTTRLVIVGWDQGAGWGSPFSRLFETLGEVPMLGLATGRNGKEAITPRQIAQGKGDGYLIALNGAINTWGRPIYIRPFAEMNGHWNSYCAFTREGAAKPNHSTADFRDAFARVYLIVHGGAAATINAKLEALGMPPLPGDLPANPMPDTRVVWNPQGYGAPDIPANSAQAYYPGDAYVDVVGNDLYYQNGKATWDANEKLYDAHPNKPYALPEWALWGMDDPDFVRAMATFVRTHKRTEAILYYLGEPGSVFDLKSKPKSLAAYRELITPLGR